MDDGRLRPGDDTGYYDLPIQPVTVNQIVAWNLAYFRRAAGLTQEALGRSLGWSKAIVSAAERSWNSNRSRQFTADDMIVLAGTLNVPLLALLLPPEDDGAGKYYVLETGALGNLAPSMAYLMLFLLPDSDSHTPVMEAYRNRLADAVSRYLEPPWRTDVTRWLDAATAPAVRAERAARLREQRLVILTLAEELASLADAIDDGTGET